MGITHTNKNNMARSGFKLKSTHGGGGSSFKMMGATPSAPSTPGESPTKQRWLAKYVVNKFIKHGDDIQEGYDYVKKLFRKSDGKVKKNLKKTDIDDALTQNSKTATDNMKNTYGGGRNKALAVGEDILDAVVLDQVFTGGKGVKGIYNTVTGQQEYELPEIPVTPETETEVIPYSKNSGQTNEANKKVDTSKMLIDGN